MKRAMIIMLICCVGINLNACGQSVPVGEDNNVEQTVVESESSSSLDMVEIMVETMAEATTEAMSVEENVSEPISDENKSIMLRDDSGLEEWKQVYLNYLDTLAGADVLVYSLIYVDDDDIPELVADSGFDGGYKIIDGGCQVILTFHDHVLDEWEPLRSRFTYIERENVICDVQNGIGVNEEFHGDSIYTIEDGKWVYVGGGYYVDRVDISPMGMFIGKLFDGKLPGEDEHIVREYFWLNEDISGFVSEEEYTARLNAIYPEGQAIYPQKYYFFDDICSIIRTGDVASAGHHYELVVEDATWEEAAAHCQEKGGYLATITSMEEMEQIQAQVISEGKTDITFFVGAKDRYWLERGTDKIDLMRLYTMLDFWLDGGLPYRGLTKKEEIVEDCFVLLYRKSDERCYLNEVVNDLVGATPSYAGKIGYICEYDN